MKILFILLSSFAVVFIVTKIALHSFDIPLSARIAMAIMLACTAIGHFVYTKGMVMMMPDSIPFKRGIVYFTGLIEICAAVGLLIPNLRVLTAWLLILFFILIFPANIKTAVRHIDFQKGTFDGKGMAYLWFRVPLQILFILWTYFSAIKF